MSPRPLLASLRVTLRDLVAPPALLLHAAAIAAAAGIGLLQAGLSSERSWVTRSSLLALVYWLPGLWVALKLRAAWPALGPGDDALGWVDLHGRPRVPPRAGAALGALAALGLLQAGTGLAAGLVACTLPGRPGFRRSLRLEARSGRRILVRAGQEERFALPALAHRTRVRLEPRYYLGPALLRAGIDVALWADGRKLASIHLPDFGAAADVALPPLGAGTLRLVRTSDPGPPISFAAGRVLVAADPVAASTAGLLLAARHGPWAALLVLVAFALAARLGPGTHALALLGLAPLVGFLPGVPAAATAAAFARGLLPAGQPLAPELVALGLGLLLVGLVPARGRTRGEAG